MFRWPKVLVVGLVFFLIVGALVASAYFVYNYQANQMALEELRPLMEAFRLVREQYVQEIGPRELLLGALEGMVESLGDPYSEYMTPDRYRELQIQTEGSYGGIGVVLTVIDEDLIVVDPPMPGSPAKAAGLAEGDQILSINGIPVEGLSFNSAAELIRGPVGTEVTLEIVRDGEVLEVGIQRDQIQLITVRWEVPADGIGYLRVSMFNEQTIAEVKSALNELMEQGMKGLILDLRGNPGGTLGAAVEVAGLFLPQGEPVLHVKGREGVQSTIRSQNGTWLELPLVVLVDGGSASASEIVAGAIQDTGRGTLVGTATFGKGSVQSIYQLTDGGGLKLTTAQYITAGGNAIESHGIEPDLVVEYQRDTEVDEQLEAALSELQEAL